MKTLYEIRDRARLRSSLPPVLSLAETEYLGRTFDRNGVTVLYARFRQQGREIRVSLEGEQEVVVL